MESSLEKLRAQIQNAEPVLQRLDLEMERIEFDPLVSASVAAANARVTGLIDKLLAGFDGNPILGPLAEQLKAQYLEGIQAQVSEARKAA